MHSYHAFLPFYIISLALHLAPLVEKGLIFQPIDLFEKSALTDVHPNEKKIQNCNQDLHPGSGTLGRDIGVGIWNTALEPLRDKYSALVKKLEYHGSYVGNVGYRTPKGAWLAQSKLNTKEDSVFNKSSGSDPSNPSLLFIREKDFLSSLREEVEQKSRENLIRSHYAKNESDMSTQVDSIILPKDGGDGISGILKFADGSTSESYHFIIAADGMNSILRSKYGGYESLIKLQKKNRSPDVTEQAKEWSKQQIQDNHALVDRDYTVFRGNSPLIDGADDGWSWQTWGEGDSMRFACVSMSVPSGYSETPRIKQQVWFATCNGSLNTIQNEEERKKELIRKFKGWHDPISKLIEATPAKDILIERGIAHKHSLYPVLQTGEVLRYKDVMETEDNERPEHDTESTIPGPILLFTGDAAMTVDPVLAQGFTIAMEAAADLSITLEQALSDNGVTKTFHFKPEKVRDALVDRSSRRYGRMLCLLRSTELVQTMAQPRSRLACILSKYIVRPSMLIAPNFLKSPAFSGVMKYSLGYFGDFSLYKHSSKEEKM
jgi:2-polyprenyl-6-methoxyphenol hydroxylase-like FAD-dependent oxidoreductase